MEQLEDGQHRKCHDVTSIDGGRLGKFVFFDRKVGKFISQEVHKLLSFLGETVLFESFSDRVSHSSESREDPSLMSGKLFFVSQKSIMKGLVRVSDRADIRVYKSDYVPEFIEKEGICLDRLIGEIIVISGGIPDDERYSQTIRRIFLDDIEGIYDIPQRLGHLATLFIKDESMEVDRFERSLVGVLVSKEEHTDHPEKEDIISGLEDIRGIKLFKKLCRISHRPVEHRKGPDPGGKPSIEYVFVSTDHILTILGNELARISSHS